MENDDNDDDSQHQWRIQEMFVGGELKKSEEVKKHTKRQKLGVRGFLPQKYTIFSGGGSCSFPNSPPVSVLRQHAHE